MNKLIVDIETIALPSDKREYWKPTISKPTWETFDKSAWAKEETQRKYYDMELMKWEVEQNTFLHGVDCALSALQGQVALIGVYGQEGYRAFVNDSDILTEHNIIRAFWNTCSQSFPKEPLEIVGFNVVGFDIPFLIRRSLLLKIPVPSFIMNDINQYRPKLIKDVRLIWAVNERQPRGKLDEIYYAAFGERMPEIKTKSGRIITGEGFGLAWAEDVEACIKYNEADVMATKRLEEWFS